MQSFDALWPALIPLAGFGYFAWRYFQTGSLVGALLGGRIKETVGEVPIQARGFGSRVLRVQTLEPTGGGPLDVALVITSKAAFAASVTPFKLSQDEARKLALLLQRAATT
jgi:hypothetical protein